MRRLSRLLLFRYHASGRKRHAALPLRPSRPTSDACAAPTARRPATHPRAPLQMVCASPESSAKAEGRRPRRVGGVAGASGDFRKGRRYATRRTLPRNARRLKINRLVDRADAVTCKSVPIRE